MKGALVFLTAFFIVGYGTTINPWIPPGRALYGLLNVPEVDYPVLGLPVSTLAISILNGVAYGLVFYVAYSLLTMTSKKDEKPRESVIIKRVVDEDS